MPGDDYRLERSQLVPRDLRTTFAFFADAANLDALTPASVHFQILTPPPLRLTPGMTLAYRIRLSGVPIHWQTRIESFEPERRFVDVQLSGPYRRWRHTHEFSAVPGGTLVVDRVDYALPFGPLGWIAHALFVRRQLEQIFDYRRARLVELFGPEPGVGDGTASH